MCLLIASSVFNLVILCKYLSFSFALDTILYQGYHNDLRDVTTKLLPEVFSDRDRTKINTVTGRIVKQ